MQVYYDINQVPIINNAIVTSGTYDGVHKGHQKILSRLQQLRSETGGKTVVITYWPHPRKIINAQSEKQKILYTLEERIELLTKYTIDFLLVINFTIDFSSLMPDEYIHRYLLERIKTKKLVIGYDHKFGKGRAGDYNYLIQNCSKFGFEIEEISREDIDSITISASNIRAALYEGNILTANLYLGLPFHLSGKVIKGAQLGSKIGYPTANISIHNEDKIIPKDGVYAVRVKINGQIYGGMLNIGFRPTVAGKTRTIEVNIFEFADEIYDEIIEIFFIDRIRSEVKFEGVEFLKKQLAEDKITAQLKLLENNYKL